MISISVTVSRGCKSDVFVEQVRVEGYFSAEGCGITGVRGCLCVSNRKQDFQRRKEYQEEMREIQERVKGRPLLLEQVAQVSLKRPPPHTHTHVE